MEMEDGLDDTVRRRREEKEAPLCLSVCLSLPLPVDLSGQAGHKRLQRLSAWSSIFLCGKKKSIFFVVDVNKKDKKYILKALFLALNFIFLHNKLKFYGRLLCPCSM
jgi:hypothetical protein